LFSTQDDDFLAIAHHRQTHGIAFNGVAFAEDDVPYRKCIDDLELIVVVKSPDEMLNWVEYLPL